MNAESLSFLMLALGILGTHAATLRLLYTCKRELNGHLSTSDERSAESSQYLDEIVRIGADVADTLEGLISGVVTNDSGSSPVISKPPNLQDTIIQFMVDRFLPLSDGSKTQQERPIFEDDPQTEDYQQDVSPETTQD